jgi:hypothetical protein
MSVAHTTSDEKPSPRRWRTARALLVSPLPVGRFARRRRGVGVRAIFLRDYGVGSGRGVKIHSSLQFSGLVEQSKQIFALTIVIKDD